MTEGSILYLKLAGIGWHFLVLGLMVGNWTARISDVQRDAGISYDILGFILISGIGGAMLGLPLGTYVTKTYGSCIACRLGAFLSSILIPIIGIKEGGVAALVIGMIGLGFGLGWLDVSNTSQAILIQKDYGVTYMGLFQCLFSLGGFFGAIVGGAFSEAGIAPLFGFVYVSAAAIPLSFLASIYLYDYETECRLLEALAKQKSSGKLTTDLALLTLGESTGAALTREDVENNTAESPAGVASPGLIGNPPIHPAQSKYLIYLVGLVGFIGYLGEGSIGDWSNIYLRDNMECSPFVSALGYAVFALIVSAVRFYSDYLILRFSRVDLLIASGFLAAGGLVICVIADTIEVAATRQVVAIIGFGVAGLGLAAPPPLVLATAGDFDDMEPSDAIAILSSICYLGIMVGPPLLGGIATALASLKWALLVDAGILFGLVLIASSGLIANHDGTNNSCIDRSWKNRRLGDSRSEAELA